MSRQVVYFSESQKWESVQILCLLPLSVLSLLSVLLSSVRDWPHDVSCLAQEKVIRTVSHTVPKLGSGAMGSRFREQLIHWTDPAVSSQPDQWKHFPSAAHEADLLYMRNFLEEITKNKYNQGGLTLKDLKPDTFESNEKSKLSFHQWSDEFSSWVERIDQDFEKLLRLAAQMQKWDKDKFIAEARQNYRLGAEKVAEFGKHIYLAMKRRTAGIAREIVDTSKTAGEAWYRLTDRFYGRNVQGATAIAGQFQELKRPTQTGKSFHLLNVIRKLVREFARQSPKEPMPSNIVKAAYMRVVPLVLVSRETRTVLTASFLKTPKLRKWSIDQGNLREKIARMHRLGPCLMNRDRWLSQSIARKLVITNSKQLEPKKNAEFYKKNCGVSNRIFVKFINKVLQSSAFDTIARRKHIEDQNTILELSGRVQELQNEVNCMNDSKDFQNAESLRSGNCHVTSRPVSFPPHPIPEGMLRHSFVSPRRKEGPPSIWDTHCMSGNVFANPHALHQLLILKNWNNGIRQLRNRFIRLQRRKVKHRNKI